MYTLDYTDTYQQIDMKKIARMHELAAVLNACAAGKIRWGNAPEIWLGIPKVDRVFRLDSPEPDCADIRPFRYKSIYQFGSIGLVIYQEVETGECGLGMIDLDTERALVKITTSATVDLIVNTDESIEKMEEGLIRLEQIIQNLRDLLNQPERVTP